MKWFVGLLVAIFVFYAFGLAVDAETNPSYYRARRYDPVGVI